MATKEVYFAVYARVEDGKLTYFTIDGEALVGSYDGHVWDEDTQEWGKDEPETAPNPYAVLSDLLDGYKPEDD